MLDKVHLELTFFTEQIYNYSSSVQKLTLTNEPFRSSNKEVIEGTPLGFLFYFIFDIISLVLKYTINNTINKDWLW